MNVSFAAEQRYDGSSQEWLADVQKQSGVLAEADLPTHFKLEDDKVKVSKADTPKVLAGKQDTAWSIDPGAPALVPYYTFRPYFPSWLLDYAGMPAYVSVNVYVSLAGKWTFDTTNLQKFMELDLADLFTVSGVSEVLFTNVNSRVSYMRAVAWGLLSSRSGQVLSGICKLSLLKPKVYTDPEVTYHVIVACGTTIMSTEALPARMEAAASAAKSVLVGDSPGEDWLMIG